MGSDNSRPQHPQQHLRRSASRTSSASTASDGAAQQQQQQRQLHRHSHDHQPGDSDAAETASAAPGRAPDPDPDPDQDAQSTRRDPEHDSPRAAPPAHAVRADAVASGPAATKPNGHANGAAHHPLDRHAKLPRRVGDYLVDSPLGKGTFAEVKLGYHVQTGAKVALKCFPKAKQNEKRREYIQREVRLLKLLCHPHICMLYEAVETEDEYILVMEYVGGGDLLKYISDQPERRLSEKEARRFFRQIVSAVAYLHTNHCIHRDIKPENVALDHEGNAKLIDFGFSQTFTDGGPKLDIYVGSPHYAAPEILYGQKYTGPEVDVYSTGVLLFGMLVGQLPFREKDMNQLYRHIMSGKVDFPDFLGKSIQHLILRMLHPDPNHRATIYEALHHPWVSRGYNGPPPTYMLPRKPVASIEEDIFKSLALYGYDPEEARIALLEDHKGPIVDMYNLLLEKRDRESSDISGIADWDASSSPAHPSSPAKAVPGARRFSIPESAAAPVSPAASPFITVAQITLDAPQATQQQQQRQPGAIEISHVHFADPSPPPSASPRQPIHISETPSAIDPESQPLSPLSIVPDEEPLNDMPAISVGPPHRPIPMDKNPSSGSANAFAKGNKSFEIIPLPLVERRRRSVDDISGPVYYLLRAPVGPVYSAESLQFTEFFPASNHETSHPTLGSPSQEYPDQNEDGGDDGDDRNDGDELVQDDIDGDDGNAGDEVLDESSGREEPVVAPATTMPAEHYHTWPRSHAEAIVFDPPASPDQDEEHRPRAREPILVPPETSNDWRQSSLVSSHVRFSSDPTAAKSPAVHPQTASLPQADAVHPQTAPLPQADATHPQTASLPQADATHPQTAPLPVSAGNPAPAASASASASAKNRGIAPVKTNGAGNHRTQVPAADSASQPERHRRIRVTSQPPKDQGPALRLLETDSVDYIDNLERRVVLSIRHREMHQYKLRYFDKWHQLQTETPVLDLDED